ncbi:coiled-coil-helix-coiled-coil-helix domain-containing protein 5, partial [Chiloscyllium plagiosum]|uniref:coiled-coil-helix-coiled-coil-helix domain-containing protein 5 n=1 Tax=Chiloscyllium plagiosum TaxID=36176 RepID=UPI001CB7E35B
PVVSSYSPVIQKIRAECAEPFLAFEQCLKQNQSSVVNCTDHVNEFLACAEKVKMPALGKKKSLIQRFNKSVKAQ